MEGGGLSRDVHSGPTPLGLGEAAAEVRAHTSAVAAAAFILWCLGVWSTCDIVLVQTRMSCSRWIFWRDSCM